MAVSLKDAITTIENLAAEPLFGGQKERLDEVLRILRIVEAGHSDAQEYRAPPTLKEAVEYWRDRFSVARGAMFMELSSDDRKQLCEIFLSLTVSK